MKNLIKLKVIDPIFIGINCQPARLALAILLLLAGGLSTVNSLAQNVSISTTGNSPDASAGLDVRQDPSNDRGAAGDSTPLRTGRNCRFDVDARSAWGQSETTGQRHAVDGCLRLSKSRQAFSCPLD